MKCNARILDSGLFWACLSNRKKLYSDRQLKQWQRLVAGRPVTASQWFRSDREFETAHTISTARFNSIPMAPWIIQIGENKVSIEGAPEFIGRMQQAVIRALQDVSLAAPAARRGRRPGKLAAAPARKATRRRGKKPGRLPGRTVNGKYIPVGAPIPAGHKEVNGKIVAAASDAPKGRGGRR